MEKRLRNWSESEGIRLLDQMVFHPVQGKKKIYIMSRTLYRIDQSEQSLIELWGSSLCGVEIYWEKHTQDDEKGQYWVKSINEPFIYNGHFVYQAALGHGDEIFIGYNRLQFLRNHEQNLEKKVISQPRMEQELYESKLNILLEGETGTGKSFLAKKIHQISGRMGHFVHVNLSAFSRNLIESELFGHVKGAYTGAINDKKGAILEANHGTLFLDEIDSLPLDIQLKLLLFLDDKKVRPVGSQKSQSADVRLIFAAGQSLANCVKKGLMRRDFFYRISAGHTQTLMSLKDDVKKIKTFSEDYLEKHGFHICRKLLDFYQQYSWPGNLRQLKAHLDKKMVLTKSKKIIFDSRDAELMSFGLEREFSDYLVQNELSLEELKRRYLLRTYYHLGCYKAASEKLGIAEKTVRNALKTVKSQNDRDYMLQ